MAGTTLQTAGREQSFVRPPSSAHEENPSMAVGTPVPITASALRVALRDSGVTSEVLADRVKTDVGTVDSWLTGTAVPFVTQFRNMAAFLGRPESFFFSRRDEREIAESDVDFRVFASSDQEPGQETLRAIQAARRVQQTSLWARRAAQVDLGEIPRLRLHRDDVEEDAAVLRRYVSWSTSVHSSRSVTDSFVAKALRSALQDLDILVLHLTLDEGVTRGFSLADSTAPLIAVNSRDHIRARTFSYVHELVHLSLRSGAVCSTRTHRGVERYCNRVAAAFLMPARAITSYTRQHFGSSIVTTTEDVGTIRNYFHVSLLAVAIRLEELGLGSPGLYDRVSREAEGRSGGRFSEENKRDKPRVRLDKFGTRFIEDLARAERAGGLERTQVLSLLQVSDQEYRRMRTLVNSDVTGDESG